MLELVQKGFFFVMNSNLNSLQQKAGYTFKNLSLLETALSHSSYVNENPSRGVNNERLEFLGDSVLGFIAAEYFYRNFSHLPEGEMTKLRAAAVCESSLCSFARKLNLGSFLRLGKGEALSGGSERPSILADAFEALLAAIYLDGGLEPASTFVLGFIGSSDAKKASFQDYKTILQEVVQRNPEEVIEYVLVGEHGPDHDKRFDIEVHLNSNIIGRGTGRSKKLAEQQAAKEALLLMGVLNEGS